MNIDSIHIEKKKHEIIIQIKITDYSRNDIKVEISNDSLAISAAHTPNRIIKSIPLPQHARTEKARAYYRHNVLTILIPLQTSHEMRMHLFHKPRILPIE
ncbi:Hsp20/alpha crystallin family protein [Aneurinibacillus sp. REN35]|uniref:Hsp20/alpha crystallin family protein n=1 Tax=Aneurinibacillus sp. REN35 TaxID=3237286 RepID=UPI0035299D49